MKLRIEEVAWSIFEGKIESICILLFIYFLLTVFCVAGYADTIEMKKGFKVEGLIVEEKDDTVKVALTSGGYVILGRKDIKKITRSSQKEREKLILKLKEKEEDFKEAYEYGKAMLQKNPPSLSEAKDYFKKALEIKEDKPCRQLLRSTTERIKEYNKFLYAGLRNLHRGKTSSNIESLRRAKNSLLEAKKAWATNEVDALITETNGLIQTLRRKELKTRGKFREKAGQIVTVHFENAHIRSVLRYLSEVGGINIVLDESVFPRGEPIIDGQTSPFVGVDLDNLPLIEALTAILRVKNLAYRIEDNLIWVTTDERMSLQKMPRKVGGVEGEVSAAKLELEKKAKQLVSLDFENTHLRKVLRYLSKVCKVNILLDENVFPVDEGMEKFQPATSARSESETSEDDEEEEKKPIATGTSPRVTVRLKDIPLIEALDVVLRTKGLDYVMEENILWVIRSQRGRKEISLVRGKEEFTKSTPAFAVFSTDTVSTSIDNLIGMLTEAHKQFRVVQVRTIEEAIASQAEVLIFVLKPYPLSQLGGDVRDFTVGDSRLRFAATGPLDVEDDILDALKTCKVIGIGHGVAELFGKLGLKICAGACAGNPHDYSPSISIEKNALVNESKFKQPIVAFNSSSSLAFPGCNFGMYIPRKSHLNSVVDVIARWARDQNYAPIVRQGNYVMIGLDAPVMTWTPVYRAFFLNLAVALHSRKSEPFPIAKRETTKPGTYKFNLAKGGSIDDLSNKTFYFQFAKPITFSAALDHKGSNNIMFHFMGRNKGSSIHGIRKDPHQSKPLAISVNITNDDIQTIEDGYWKLRVVNFDRQHGAHCSLKIEISERTQETTIKTVRKKDESFTSSKPKLEKIVGKKQKYEKTDEKRGKIQYKSEGKGESVVVDPSPIVKGINSIVCAGVAGPLLGLNPNVVPVVAGNIDTTPVPSVVTVATGFGKGRVVALGHGGFLADKAPKLFDNKQFVNNIIDWLAEGTGKRKILVTRGHREWVSRICNKEFEAALESRGYTVTRFSGKIKSSKLSRVGVILVGTAWGTVSPTEISALTDFVSSGGGLLLTGLGWSWEPYNPGFTLDDYPMNKIGEQFGIRWIGGFINDPTDNYEGQPIFHTFYPNIGVQTSYQAFSYIKTITSANPDKLPALLQTDKTICRKYANSHLLLATMMKELDQSNSQRQEIYNFYRTLINNYPQYFGKEVIYDKSTQSTMAWIRERVYCSFINALPLTKDRKSEIASTIRLFGPYLNLWNDFTLLLLDNTSLSEKQRDFIYNYLTLLPKGLHNLRSISVADNLGKISKKVPLGSLEGSVNIFGIDIGACTENSFPSDSKPGYIPVFCACAAHEVNHVVDAYTVESDAKLKARKYALIQQAAPPNIQFHVPPNGYGVNWDATKKTFLLLGYWDGSNDSWDSAWRTYWKSGRGKPYEQKWLRNNTQLMCEAPQEAFATLANQYFTNGKTMFDLCLKRWKQDVKSCINQFLFFADVYSMGKNFTYFYTTDKKGNITRETIPLSRDSDGRISSLTIDNQTYVFRLRADGNVIGYVSRPSP